MPQNAPHWVDRDNYGLLTDLYELTMLQSYFTHGFHGEAVFDLFVRKLPPGRNYLIACGLDEALACLEHLDFPPESIAYLRSTGQFTEAFLKWLAGFRFTGTVRAIPEGTVVFPGEPLLEVKAPLPQAQLVETLLLNQMTFQTMVASKAARVVDAARGKPIVDFGLRRTHGADAGLKAARAAFVAGVSATSNVLAGKMFQIPISGTMAHSYVQSFENEDAAFRAFLQDYPEAILLVDTYDTEAGVDKVIRLAAKQKADFHARGIRLDSGDLALLAKSARAKLDAAGLTSMKIFASGGLDEETIEKLLDQGAPIDGFGVGTLMSSSADYPHLDTAYKLVAYEGEGRLKLSSHKTTYPGSKQVFRQEKDGVLEGDVIGLAEEDHPGRPLLAKVMEGGRLVDSGPQSLESLQQWACASRDHLPAPYRALAPPEKPYPVSYSAAMERHFAETKRRVLAEGKTP